MERKKKSKMKRNERERKRQEKETSNLLLIRGCDIELRELQSYVVPLSTTFDDSHITHTLYY